MATRVLENDFVLTDGLLTVVTNLDLRKAVARQIVVNFLYCLASTNHVRTVCSCSMVMMVVPIIVLTTVVRYATRCAIVIVDLIVQKLLLLTLHCCSWAISSEDIRFLTNSA